MSNGERHQIDWWPDLSTSGEAMQPLKPLPEMDEPELRFYLNLLLRHIEDALPIYEHTQDRYAFALLLIDEADKAHYISNCDRLEAVRILRAAADGLEAREKDHYFH